MVSIGFTQEEIRYSLMGQKFEWWPPICSWDTRAQNWRAILSPWGPSLYLIWPTAAILSHLTRYRIVSANPNQWGVSNNAGSAISISNSQNTQSSSAENQQPSDGQEPEQNASSTVNLPATSLTVLEKKKITPVPYTKSDLSTSRNQNRNSPFLERASFRQKEKSLTKLSSGASTGFCFCCDWPSLCPACSRNPWQP